MEDKNSTNAKRAWRTKRNAKRARQANQNISYNENSDSDGNEEKTWTTNSPTTTSSEQQQKQPEIIQQQQLQKETPKTKENSPSPAQNNDSSSHSTGTTSNVQQLKDLLVKQKIAALTCEIEAVERGSHPELAQRLEQIDKKLERKLMIAQAKREFQANCANEQFLERVNAAQQDYQAAERELRRSCLEKLEKMLLKRRRACFFVPRQDSWTDLLHSGIGGNSQGAGARECFLSLTCQLSQADVQRDLEKINNKVNCH